MDEKNTEEVPKLTRSRARHLRRKRLIIARRAAENNLSITNDKSNEIIEINRNKESEIISKSKAKRLRKKNKLNSLQSSPSVSFDNSELNSQNSCSTTEDFHPESDKNNQETINNEKNLKINESHKINSELIINNIVEENKTKLNVLFCDSSNNDVSHKVPVSHVVSQSSEIINNKINSVISKEIKMNSEGKTREQIKAEREAKKAAKAAAKNKGKSPITDTNTPSSKSSIENMKNPPKNQITNDCCSTSKTKSEDDQVEKVEIPIVTEKLSKLHVSDYVTAAYKILDEFKSGKKYPTKEEINKLELKNILNETKSKAELRTERRLKQEAQRAAKDQQKKINVKSSEPPKSQKIHEKIQEKIDDSPKIRKKTIIKSSSHEVNLFKHLYHEREQAFLSTPIVNSSIHPAIVRLGVQYANKIIVGSNARCIGLLAAVKQLIKDFERPSQADFTRGLETSLQESSSYLHHCRPLAVSMCNALRHLKWQMTQLPSTISDDEAKSKLANAIDTYIQEQILLADQAISITIQTKISNGDVILTYGYSSLIQKILCDAHDKGKQFRVIVVDGRPWLEGRELLRRLAKHGIECSYVLINALSFIMQEVSKVFLGAHAILANGAVMSRAGTAQVALMAKAFNVPVLVACETHKTCERVQTDSIVHNEIGDADELAQNMIGNMKKTSALTNWRAKKSLNLLNLTYDVTPADLITAVVTEIAILPCTSVPVILRIKPTEI